MKTLLASLLLLTASASGTFAASPPASPSSEYEKAVKSYVEAASNDLTAVRTGLEADAKDATGAAKPRRNEVTAALQRCEKLLADLKKAGPADFDRVKSEYEKARASLTKQLDGDRRP